MAHYVSITGWVSVDSEDIEPIKKVIAVFVEECEKFEIDKGRAKAYSNGWCFQEESVRWSRYVFFGADINSEDIEFIKKQVRKIAELNDEITGKFFVEDVENTFVENWKTEDGKLMLI